MYPSSSNFEQQHRQAVLEGRRVLERTGESIIRSNQVAIETENIGVGVVSELSEQRETLLRAKDRLNRADDHLDSTRALLRKMGRNVIYNKLILILIIVLEVCILLGLSYLKFFKK